MFEKQKPLEFLDFWDKLLAHKITGNFDRNFVRSQVLIWIPLVKCPVVRKKDHRYHTAAEIYRVYLTKVTLLQSGKLFSSCYCGIRDRLVLTIVCRRWSPTDIDILISLFRKNNRIIG